MKCKKCGSINIVKNGSKYRKYSRDQQFKCKDCGYHFSETHNYVKGIRPSKKEAVNILIFDIETLPVEGLFFSLWKPILNPVNILKDWCVLSWSAKWLYSQDVFSDILTPEEAIERNDKRLLGGIYELFNDADIVVAHNGDKFDIRRLNARWFLNGFAPVDPFQSIDTLKQSRRLFAHTSHRLTWLGEMILRDEKLHTDFELWKRCHFGDQESLDYMLQYNCQDTLLLEEVFEQMKPWMKMPNVGIYYNDNKIRCNSCGSENVKETDKFYITPANKFTVCRCQDCGSLGRLPATQITTAKRLSTLRSI